MNDRQKEAEVMEMMNDMYEEAAAKPIYQAQIYKY